MKAQNIKELNKKKLRQQLRNLRRNIGHEEQLHVAKHAAFTAMNQSIFPLGEAIALYMPADGELDTRYLLEALLAEGKKCYLPVLVNETTTLQFRQYQPGMPLVTNFFGLSEPEPTAPTIAPNDLTTVFMPLVAFDDSGNRLGMGKGYYDRTFEFLMHKHAADPVLIGLAHECQRVESLDAADWDVPMKGIITGQNFTLAKK